MNASPHERGNIPVHTVVMDEDVRRVMERMQQTVAAEKLVKVAQTVAALAPDMWGHYTADGPRTLGHLSLQLKISLNPDAPIPAVQAPVAATVPQDRVIQYQPTPYQVGGITRSEFLAAQAQASACPSKPACAAHESATSERLGFPAKDTPTPEAEPSTPSEG